MENKKHLLLTLIFFLFISIILIGQTTPNPDSRPTPIGLDHRVLGMARTTSEFYTHPDGNQYKNSIYKKAQLYNTYNDMIGEFLIRYNMYRDEMESSDGYNRNRIFYKEGLSKVTLEEIDYYVFEYKNDNKKIVKGFFHEIFATSNCSIYKQERKKIELGKLAKDGYRKHTNTKFVETEKFYLKFTNTILLPVKFKKSRLIKTFPKHQNELKTFIKKSKIKLNTVDELIKLAAHYNNLNTA